MSRPTPAPPSTAGVDRGRRRLVCGLLAAPVLLTALPGCSERPTTPSIDGRVQLSIFWWGSPQRAELTERALQLYSQRNPMATFRVTWQGEAGYYERLAVQAAGGNAPDLFQIDDNYLTEYAERNILLDLGRFVVNGRLDLGGLSPSLIKAGQVGGRPVAVAAAQNTPGLVYNRSLLRRLDLPEPRIGMTYDEYLPWASRVTRRSGGRVAGTMDPSADHRALWLWLRAQGKELYRDRRLGFGAADLARWFELWQRARADRATPSAAVVHEANTTDLRRQLVVTGQTAASFAWSNQLLELQKYTADELAVVTYPGDPAAQWARASMYWAGFRGTRHPEIVADVIDFLTNDVEAGRILGADRGISANLAVREVVQGTPTAQTRVWAAFEAAVADLLGPAPVPPPKGHAAVQALLVTAAEDAQFGRASPAAAAVQFSARAAAAMT